MSLAFRKKGRTRLLHCLPVLVVLLGFLGQIFIQGFALPDEAPRATIERLTGIDISPSGMMDDMPGMHMAMPGHMHHPQGTHDHDDGSCPLCPLLQIVAILLTALPLFPGRSFRWTALRAQPIQPRAPPIAERALPPSRGPPTLF